VIESIMVNSAFWGVYIGFLLILPLFNKREKQIIFSLILHPIRTIKLRGI
jgi:hypothetical protein